MFELGLIGLNLQLQIQNSKKSIHLWIEVNDSFYYVIFIMVQVQKFSFQAPPQKYAYENHKKHSTQGQICYEIEHNFCFDTLNESCYE